MNGPSSKRTCARGNGLAPGAGGAAWQSEQAAQQAAVNLIYQYVNLRASITAFQMDYVISAVVILIGILPAFLLPVGRVKKGNGPAMPME